MPYTFNSEDHTMSAYRQNAESFIAANGCTPMEVLASRDQFPKGTVLRAEFLNAWDLWLFSSEGGNG